jgi:hypothetical protein
MKKLLTLLLTFSTLFSFSQDILVRQNWKEDVSNSQVGDTITLQLQWIDVMDDVLDPNPTIIQVDWEYNTDLLQLQSHQFIATDNPNASKSFNSWLNYNFAPKDNVGTANQGALDLSAQYEAGLSYPSTQGWGINRITMQDSGEIVGNTGNGDKILVEVKYIIKDIEATNYTTYEDLVTLNWAHFRDNRTGETYSVFADPLTLSLENVAGSPAGTVTFQLETPNAENGEDYMIVIEPLSQYNSADPIENYVYVEGALNTSGQFITTELKQDIPYIFNVFIKSEWDQANDRPIYPQWLDDVVTVSDVMQVFKQAIGTNPDGTGNHFQYNIQKRLANVKQDGPNDPINFDDSYILLAHIAGILDNGAEYGNSNAEEFYPITSFNNGAMNTSGFFDTFGTPINSEEEWLASRTFTLTDDEPITFNVAHGLMGDADLSHSTTPNLNDDTKIQAIAISKSRRGMNILKSLPQETIDLDIVSQFENGKVALTVNLTKEDLAGMQFNISYDNSILNFDDIIFDTGNTMTNFAKHFEDGRINFGTINIEEANIKTGVPFKLVFTPKVSIQNTVGLISFRVTDAVKHDGTKVELNLQ